MERQRAAQLPSTRPETPSIRMSPASATASFTAPTAPFSLKSWRNVPETPHNRNFFLSSGLEASPCNEKGELCLHTYLFSLFPSISPSVKVDGRATKSSAANLYLYPVYPSRACLGFFVSHQILGLNSQHDFFTHLRVDTS